MLVANQADSPGNGLFEGHESFEKQGHGRYQEAWPPARGRAPHEELAEEDQVGQRHTDDADFFTYRYRRDGNEFTGSVWRTDAEKIKKA